MNGRGLMNGQTSAENRVNKQEFADCYIKPCTCADLASELKGNEVIRVATRRKIELQKNHRQSLRTKW